MPPHRDASAPAAPSSSVAAPVLTSQPIVATPFAVQRTRDPPPHVPAVVPPSPRSPRESPPHSSPRDRTDTSRRRTGRRSRSAHSRSRSRARHRRRRSSHSPSESATISRLVAAFETAMSLVHAHSTMTPSLPRQSANKIRLPKPDEFTGDSAKLQPFLNACMNIFHAQPEDFNSPEKQIRYALTLIKGDASDWLTDLYDQIAEGSYHFSSWSSFEERLRASFANPHERQDAQRRLRNLSQGDRNAGLFLVEFEHLRRKSRFGEDTALFFLIDALRQDLHDACYRVTPQPTTVDGYKNLILECDNLLRTRNASTAPPNSLPYAQKHPLQPFRRWQPFRRPDTTSPSPPSLNLTPAPSLVPKPAPIKLSTSKEIKPFNCYACGESGHIARNCTKPRKFSERMKKLLDHVDTLADSVEVVRKVIDEDNDETAAEADDDAEVLERLQDLLSPFFVQPDE